MRLTEEELALLLQRPGYHEVEGVASNEKKVVSNEWPVASGDAERDPSDSSLATSHKPRATLPYRSQTEARYADVLISLVQGGMLAQWWYEPARLWLAPKTTYTPDFLLHFHGHGPLVFVEIKGAWIRPNALVKPKIAARLYPMFRFTLVTWKDQAWHEKEIPHA
jgi:hypothetical protein